MHRLMTRKEQEIRTVGQMIRIYCRGNHGGGGGLCADCQRLLDYASERIRLCPKGDGKRTCRVCEIHCYRPEMREGIRNVMRYAGPRMILHHPVAAIVHLIREM